MQEGSVAPNANGKGKGKKDFPAERRVSAVIRISEFDESPEQAVQTVLENPQFFKDLHIVKFGYSTVEKLYPEWPTDLEALEKLGLSPVWHADLDLRKLETHAIVELTPDLRATDGALTALIEDMNKYGGSCDHYAVSSITFVEYAKRPTPGVVLEALLSYGFLLVVLMMDTFRSAINLFQYHRTVDLRATFTMATYGERVRLAPNRWWMWWFFTGTCTSKRGGAACMQVPSEKDQGLQFVLRTIKTHRSLGIGLWIFGFALYYFFFAWPYWNYLVDPRTRLGSWLSRDMTALYWMIPYLLHTALVGWVAWQWIELPFRLLPLLIIGYTFVLTVSPIILFYARFHSSRAAWKRK